MAWFHLRVLLALSSWVLFIWKVCIYVLLGVSLTACTLLCPWVVCLAVVAACSLGLCKTALLMLEYLLPHRGDKEERGREKWKAARCRRTIRKEQLKEQRERKNVRSMHEEWTKRSDSSQRSSVGRRLVYVDRERCRSSYGFIDPSSGGGPCS